MLATKYARSLAPVCAAALVLVASIAAAAGPAHYPTPDAAAQALIDAAASENRVSPTSTLWLSIRRARSARLWKCSIGRLSVTPANARCRLRQRPSAGIPVTAQRP